MAATAAVAKARSKAPSIIPPASPFAELLRRSKFATFDPKIRQAYFSPPANAHRGDWGLKRPISQRRKNAFIWVKSFEHHAHFTEWNHAENEVRFIRRIEELKTSASPSRNTPWEKSLGRARENTEILWDSDFCPEKDEEEWIPPHSSSVAASTDVWTTPISQYPAASIGNDSISDPINQLTQNTNKSVALGSKDRIPLDTLGQKGPGNYGLNRQPPTQAQDSKEFASFAIPNIYAMSKRHFARYLRQLRRLGPEFREHIKTHTPGMKGDEYPDLYRLALRNVDWHRKFLMAREGKLYKRLGRHKIEPQPHPNGALVYTRTSRLESLLWGKPKTGVMLNPDVSPRLEVKAKAAIVNFAGVAISVPLTELKDKQSLFDADSGIDREAFEKSVVPLRAKKIVVQVPPTSVGSEPLGLDGVKIEVNTETEADVEAFGKDNPHPLGSPEYVAAERTFDIKIIPTQSSSQKLPFYTAGAKKRIDAEQSRQILSKLHEMARPGGNPSDYLSVEK